MTELLYAPWREEFILGKKPDGCIFCDPEKRRGVRELILHRGKLAFVVLNRYPYNSGHLMVVPYRHVGHLEDLSAAEQKELMALMALSSRVLHESSNPGGINIGMNLGRAAGAGVEGHLHAHLVPRWVGDTNFMPALFDTRVTSVDLNKVGRRLKAGFRKATGSQKK
jgi:ATP adenylyltransferase